MRKQSGQAIALVSLFWVGITGWGLTVPPSPGEGNSEESQPTLRQRAKHLPVPLIHSGEEHAALARSLALLRVPGWHAAGRRGKGVTVAVLDSGLKGWSSATGKVLPSRVTAKSFRKDGRFDARESQHGILCGEVIHRIAPEANLLLANWEPETPGAFLDAVRWARRQGARVISCSMIMPGWSDGEGGGPVHRELAKILGNEVLFFASAGNTAQRHHGGTAQPDRDGWHRWQPGVTANVLIPLAAERISVELVHGAGGRFELVVSEVKSGEAIGRSQSNGSGHAVVRFEPRPGRTYAVGLRVLVGSRPRFHLTTLGAKLTHATQAGSVPFPGDGAGVVAVTAVDEGGRRHSYSSCGPVSSRPKPDLSARVPVPSRWRPGQPFSGTSAAAPQAAGVAALVWAQEPGLSATQVRTRLEGAAQRAREGHSPETGHGVLRVPEMEIVKSPLDTVKRMR